MKTTKFAKLSLAAIALATLTLSASPVFAEDAPTSPPVGDVAHDGPRDKDHDKDDRKEGKRAEFEKRGKEMFAKTDTDKDGFLSREEMAASQKERMDEMFAKTDTDKDGKLSPEELKKGREAMRERFRAKDKDREHRGPKDDQPETEKPAQ